MAKKSRAFDPFDLFKRADAQATTQDYVNRERIFSQGDKANAMFYIQSGHVKLTVTSGSGKKAVLGILTGGECFGEGCLTKLSLRKSTAMAIESSTVTRVTGARIARIIHSEPAFAKRFMAHLLAQIGRIEGDFADQIFSSSEKRLARILLKMAGFENAANPQPTDLKVSQETLAEMVGTTRSRVSYFMNQFRKRGFIQYDGTLQVYPSLVSILAEK